MGATTMRVIIERSRGDVRMACEGEIDLSTADQFEEAFREVVRASPARLELDLSNVPFMDSTGLHILTRITKTCAEMGIAATIHPSVIISKLLMVTGLDAALPLARNDTQRTDPSSRAPVFRLGRSGEPRSSSVARRDRAG